MKIQEDIKIFTHENAGPNVVMLGCTHGNEVIGKNILDWLAENIAANHVSGQITLILANKAAYSQNKRFIDVDMNRLAEKNIIKEITAKPVAERNIEEARILELIPYLKDADYLLDIHATVKPTPSPFAYCDNTNAHLSVAECFDVPYIISPKSLNVTKTMSTCFDNYVDSIGGIGITLEAGWMGEAALGNTIIEGVKRYLNSVGICNFAAEKHHSQAKQLIIYQEVIAESDDFEFKIKAENLRYIEKNQLVAVDGNKEIVVNQSSYIIFPKRNIRKNMEACYLAYEN